MPYRENYALLPPETSLIMYIVLIPFAIIFLYGAYLKLREYGYTAIVEVVGNFRRWLTLSIRYAVLQKRIVGEISAGFMHLSTSYGILILFIGTLLVFIDSDIFEALQQKLLQGIPYIVFELFLDFFGMLFIIGISLEIARRYYGVKRLKPRSEYFAYLWGLFFIGITGFLLEGLRIYLRQPPWSRYSFMGNIISNGINVLEPSPEIVNNIYVGIWWAHALTAFGLVAALPYTNLRHTIISLIYSGLTYSAPRLPLISKTPFKLSEVDLSALEEVKIGFRNISDLDWLQKMGLDACIDCGRCESVCPAFSSGTPLSPRNLIQKLAKIMWMNKSVKDRDLLESKDLLYDEIYACTTCGGCTEACPVVISPLEYIIEARRAILVAGRLEKKARETLNNLTKFENPYGLPRAERIALTKELRSLGAETIDENPSPEYIYWIGCLATYDNRVRNIVKKMVEILVTSKINFAILGGLERCTGEIARRIGEEGLFQELAYKNIEMLKNVNAKKILVHCPHCYQIFNNEYKELGLEVNVVHHSMLLSRLVSEGKIKPKIDIDTVITLHDSCYIARFNNIISEPRSALKDLRMREMERRGKNTFCCGAGGGSYWSEVKRTKRECVQRVEEALKIGAQTIVTECPYCLIMFEDAIKVLGAEDRLKALDVSEIF